MSWNYCIVLDCRLPSGSDVPV